MDGGTQNNINVSITPSTVIWAILIVLFFVMLYILRDLVLVILTSVLLAAAISPVAKWFVAHRVPRVAAVIIIYVGVLAFFAGAFYFLLVPLLQEMFALIRNLPEYLETFEAWVPLGDEQGAFEGFPILGDVAAGFSPREIIEHIQEAIGGITQGFVSTLFTVFGGVVNFVLIIVLSFYLAVQENGVGQFLRMVTPARHEAYVLDLWRRTEIKMGYWLQGQLILAVIVAVLVYLGLTLLGVPHALLLAVLAGVFELIPVFGPILAAIPAVAIALVEGGTLMGPGLGMGLVVTGLYIIIQQFESQLIYPLVIRKVVGLAPIIVIISLIAGFQLAGFLGIILSVPVAAVVLEFLNDMQKSDNVKPAASGSLAK